MNARRRLLLLSLLLCLPAQAALLRLNDGKLSVYYDPVDSLHAREALRLGLRITDDLRRDLRLPSIDTLHLFIAPSRAYFREAGRGQLPSWTQGFAVPEQRMLMVKSPRWDRPENDFAATLSHEILHLMMGEKIGRRALPRWMEEGLALFYSERAVWNTRTALSKALLTRSAIPLRDIDRVLEFERHRAELAYQQSLSAITYLLATYDVEALNTILDRLAAGDDIDRAFFEATGSTLADFEKEWLRAAADDQRWYWLADINDYIWFIALFLFLLALVLIRRRNRKKLAEWEGPPAVVEWRAWPNPRTAAEGDAPEASIIALQEEPPGAAHEEETGPPADADATRGPLPPPPVDPEAAPDRSGPAA